MQINSPMNWYDYRIVFPAFAGKGTVAVKTLQAGADTFARQTENPIIVSVNDVEKYLKQKRFSKIFKHGRIFNDPLTGNGDSLLLAFLRIKPTEEEKTAYNGLLSKMSRMLGINYDQKDSMNISALEWAMAGENKDVLKLFEGKKLTIDPLLYNVYKQIKNQNFKIALIEMGIYRPPVFETNEEKQAIVKSILISKYKKKNVDDSCVENIVNSLSNNDNVITQEIFGVL